MDIINFIIIIGLLRGLTILCFLLGKVFVHPRMIKHISGDKAKDKSEGHGMIVDATRNTKHCKMVTR